MAAYTQSEMDALVAYGNRQFLQPTSTYARRHPENYASQKEVADKVAALKAAVDKISPPTSVQDAAARVGQMAQYNNVLQGGGKGGIALAGADYQRMVAANGGAGDLGTNQYLGNFNALMQKEAADSGLTGLLNTAVPMGLTAMTGAALGSATGLLGQGATSAAATEEGMLNSASPSLVSAGGGSSIAQGMVNLPTSGLINPAGAASSIPLSYDAAGYAIPATQALAQAGISPELAAKAVSSPGLMQQISNMTGLSPNMIGMAATLGASALGGKSGGNNMQTATTTTSNIPNQYVQEYLPQYLNRASALSNVPYQAYGGQQVADFTPYQNQALGMIGNRAIAGNPLMDSATQNLTDTASGKYLDVNSNPYLQGTINKTLGEVRGMTGATFSGNNFGGSAHEEMLQRKGIEAISPYLLNNYTNERNNQMQASGMAPTVSAAGYNDANQLLQAGNMQQGQQQNILSAKYNDYLRQQQYPYTNLGVLGNAVNVAGGGGGTTSANAPNPYAKNSLASGLGTAATVAGLANQAGMFGTPATATAPATQASPWAWPLVIGGGLLGGMM